MTVGEPKFTIWPKQAFAIAIIEFFAFATHGRVPTVTDISRRLPRLAVYVWAFLLAQHLTKRAAA